MVAEPPSDWEIPMMYRHCRYDVGLEYFPGRLVTYWCMDADMVKVIEAVTEVLVMKEKKPDEFAGNIIIRPSADTSRDPGPEYNGSKCEEDSDDNRSRRNRRLQSVGGDHPNARHPSDHYNSAEQLKKQEDFRRAQAQLEDATMVGECCPCMASFHAYFPPFKCTVCSKCTGWDSGE